MESFELVPYKNNAEIIKATCNQIVKDFNMVGMQLELPNELIGIYDELLKLLQRQLSVLLEKDHDGLYNLLYRMDIQANAIKKAKHTGNHTDDTELMASLIIYRAFQKVMLRRYFSNR